VTLRDLLYAVYERRLARRLGTANRPRHVAVIMDGNRRWAKEAGFADVSDGHRVGAARLVELLGWCRETGVEIATFWLLSPDNLRNRPPDELAPLLEIIAGVVDGLLAGVLGGLVRTQLGDALQQFLPAAIARGLALPELPPGTTVSPARTSRLTPHNTCMVPEPENRR